MTKPTHVPAKIAEIVFFATLLFFSIKPVFNFDFWFHIKYGEYILTTHSLPFRDVFSHTAYGQPAVPYEWLFQVVLYLVYHSVGTIGVQALVATLLLTYILLFRQILKEIFHVSLLPRFLLIGTAVILSFDFWVERPQSAAFAIFMAVFYLLLKRIFLAKKVLIYTIPLFLIWTNLHASFIVGLYLFASFATIVFLSYLLKKDRENLHLAKDLSLFGLINFAITFLPPLSYKVYQLLWLFFEKRTLITSSIDEWVPLTELSARFYLYLAIIGLCLIALIIAWRKKAPHLLYFLPLLPLGFFVLSGVRQTAFSMPAFFLLAVPFLKSVRIKLKSILGLTLFLIMLFGSGYLLFLYRELLLSIKRPYPTQAIPFIKQHIQGNMFNELFIGGYLLYELGPEKKTFIDGRTDMFLPTVFPEYLKLDTFPDDHDFYRYFMSLVRKYHVSWVIITNREIGLYNRFVSLLPHHDRWHLVYFDDTSEIYVRGDGKNDETIADFSLDTIAPSTTRLYTGLDRNEAIKEYEAMYRRTPSALAAKGAGILLMQDGNNIDAQTYLHESVSIDPHDTETLIALAEVQVRQKQYQAALDLYQKILALDKTNSFVYLRLGQLMIFLKNDRAEAHSFFEQGLQHTSDPAVKAELEKALAD